MVPALNGSATTMSTQQSRPGPGSPPRPWSWRGSPSALWSERVVAQSQQNCLSLEATVTTSSTGGNWSEPEIGSEIGLFETAPPPQSAWPVALSIAVVTSIMCGHIGIGWLFNWLISTKVAADATYSGLPERSATVIRPFSISMILIVAAQAYGRLCSTWAVAVFAHTLRSANLPARARARLPAPADAEAIAPEGDS